MIKGRSGGSSSRTSINSSNPADPWPGRDRGSACKRTRDRLWLRSPLCTRREPDSTANGQTNCGCWPSGAAFPGGMQPGHKQRLTTGNRLGECREKRHDPEVGDHQPAPVSAWSRPELTAPSQSLGIPKQGASKHLKYLYKTSIATSRPWPSALASMASDGLDG